MQSSTQAIREVESQKCKQGKKQRKEWQGENVNRAKSKVTRGEEEGGRRALIQAHPCLVGEGYQFQSFILPSKLGNRPMQTCSSMQSGTKANREGNTQNVNNNHLQY